MKKTILASLFVLGLVVLPRVSLAWESLDISMVKEGRMSIDNSITVGSAFNTYKYFRKTEWEVLKDEKGRRIVQVLGEVDKDIFSKKDIEKQNKFLIEGPTNTDEFFYIHGLSHIDAAGRIKQMNSHDISNYATNRYVVVFQFILVENTFSVYSAGFLAFAEKKSKPYRSFFGSVANILQEIYTDNPSFLRNNIINSRWEGY